MAEGSGDSVSIPAELAAAVDRALTAAKRSLAQQNRAARRLNQVERERGPERALLVARNQDGLSGPGLVMELIRRAVGERSRNPATARLWAEAAVQKAESAGISGLLARAWAEKGNAERILEDFPAARASFDRALEVLERDDGGLLSYRGDVLSLLGSLEHALRRPDPALACLDEALQCYRELKMARDVWKVQVKKANIYLYRGEFTKAIAEASDVVARSLAYSDEIEEATLLPACHVTLLTLVEAALTAESMQDKRLALDMATRELVRLTPFYLSCSASIWRLRRQWLMGRLLVAREQLRGAARIFDRTVAEFLDLGFPATAAVVALDLTLVLARQGELGELRATAGAACVVLEAAGLQPDAWAAQRMLLDCDLSTAETVIVKGLQRAGGASLRRTPGRS